MPLAWRTTPLTSCTSRESHARLAAALAERIPTLFEPTGPANCRRACDKRRPLHGRRHFNPENDFWRLIEKLVDLFLLSVFWLVCSLPVFTLGPATAALYRTVARCIRGSERKSWSLFFVPSGKISRLALTTLVVVAVGAVLFVLYTLLYQTASLNRAGYILFMAYYLFLLLPLGLLCYLFPVLSQFEFGVGGLLSNCAKLAIAHLPSTIALALLLYAALTVCLNFFLAIAVTPALLALLHSLLLERIFAPTSASSWEKMTMTKTACRIHASTGCFLFLFLRQQLIEFRHKGADVLKLPVHRREADIGHLVHLSQPVHHQLPNLRRGDLPVHVVLENLLNFVGNLLQLSKGHRALLTGPDHAVEQLAFVKCLAAAILLDDHQRQTLHGLIGCKPLMARQALPAAADTGPSSEGRESTTLLSGWAQYGHFMVSCPLCFILSYDGSL